jgi:hypothetical protein
LAKKPKVAQRIAELIADRERLVAAARMQPEQILQTLRERAQVDRVADFFQVEGDALHVRDLREVPVECATAFIRLACALRCESMMLSSLPRTCMQGSSSAKLAFEMTPPAAMTPGMAFHAEFLGEVAEWPKATALRYGTQVTLCRKFESFPSPSTPGIMANIAKLPERWGANMPDPSGTQGLYAHLNSRSAM